MCSSFFSKFILGMKVLVIGSGGREHALAWKLKQSLRVNKVFVAPGNAGTALEKGLQNIPISTISDLVEFAKNEHIEITIVGPEALLAEGISTPAEKLHRTTISELSKRLTNSVSDAPTLIIYGALAI